MLRLIELREAKSQAKPADFESFLHEVNPTWSWEWKHLQYIRAHLHRVTLGAILRLMLQVPPRHGKSEMVTVRYAAYRLLLNEYLRIIVAAYSAFLAHKFSRKIRRIVTQRATLSTERRAVDDWELANGIGGLRAVGVGMGVTGTGGDLVLIDDPIKSRKEADSEAYRETIADWYTDDLYTRLEPGAAMVLTMTRWHVDDIAGRIQRNEYGDAAEWHIINLPAICEEVDDPLGRMPGDAICPERYDEVALARIKKVLGDSFFALFQGRPIAGSGNVIKREWFRYWSTEPRADERLMTVQSWDTGSKPNQINDPSVCTTWGVERQRYCLLEEWRERVDFPALLKAAKTQAENSKPNAVLIEDKGNGTALIQALRASTTIPVIPIEPEGDKVMRLSAESAAYEAGLVYHPAPAVRSWVHDFEAELIAIPNAPNDDRGDSVSQFLKWVRQHGAVGAIETLGQQRAALEFDSIGNHHLGDY